MHLKVFLNLKKPLKLSLLGKYILKNKKTHWAGFLKKPGFFPTLGANTEIIGNGSLVVNSFDCQSNLYNNPKFDLKMASGATADPGVLN